MLRGSSKRELAVIVAVFAVRMMEMSIDHVVNMISVGHGFVSAVGTMGVGGFVTLTGVIRGAVRGVAAIDFQRMFVHVTIMRVVKVPGMKVVDVVAMLDGRVSTIGAVGVLVVLVFVTTHSVFLLTGVFEHASNKLGDVAVGERVELVLAFAPPR